MVMNKNPEVFPGKQFTDVLKDIYDTATAKRQQIESIMTTLVTLVGNSPQNAAVLTPLIKDLLEVGVKNDDHIVKVATLIQRIMSSDIQASGASGDVSSMLSDEEKNKLLLEAEKDAITELHLAVQEAEEIKTIKNKAKAAIAPSSGSN